MQGPGKIASRLDDEQRIARALSVAGRELDDELQALAKTAAECTGFSMALVSLVSRRRQTFRAHYGLPEELVVVRGTDRCVSFCQFVVDRDEALLIENVDDHPALPRELIERYGLRAYVGVPLVLAGLTVGTLCVLDCKTHSNLAEVREKLRPLARRVEERLDDLREGESEVTNLLGEAAAPAFAEMRNNLMTLGLLSSHVAEICQGLSSVHRLAEALESGQLDAEQAAGACRMLFRDKDVEPLLSAGADLDRLAFRLTQDVAAIQRLLAPTRQVYRLGRSLAVANQLALHTTRPAGGLRWERTESDTHILGPEEGVATLLALAFSRSAALAQDSQAGIDVCVDEESDKVVVYVGVPGRGRDDYAHIASDLQEAFRNRIEVAVRADCLALSFPIHASP